MQNTLKKLFRRPTSSQPPDPEESPSKSQFPKEQDPQTGTFVRQDDQFREWIEDRDGARFPAAPDRYHLYVSLACPWAHRTVIMRALKKLDHLVGMTVVDPLRDENGWQFSDSPGCSLDPVNQFTYLREAYLQTDPDYRGRVTVPVLWDKQEGRIVSNSDDDLMRMFNSVFNRLTDDESDFYPAHLRPEIDRLNDVIYETVNNGVYKAGFATSQKAYEAAVFPLFDTLDAMESRLARTPYLLGDQITETDWRLWVTLLRFDPVYHGHFKCNLRRLSEYPHLSTYLKRLYEIPGIAETVNLDHIKRHYYMTHQEINPSGVVPVGPASLWNG